MKKLNILFVLSIAIAALFTSCESNDPIPMTNISLTIAMPEGVTPEEYTDFTVEFLNQSTKTTTTATISDAGIISATVEQGVYNVTINGKGTITQSVGDGDNASTVEQTVSVRGLMQETSISGDTFESNVELFVSRETSGWVIKEIYFAGSKTPEGKNYIFDNYIEIYNNTDEVMYADGLCIAESDHTNFLVNKWGDQLADAFVPYVIYQVPGSGTDVPVRPGQGIVLADKGIDHTQINTNSIDLSQADFEWVDEHRLDTDTPEVPNLNKIYSGSSSIWLPHGRGYKAYALFKLDVTTEEFFANNKVEYTSSNGRVTTRYKVDNSLILDAVELGDEAKFKSKAVTSQLDLTFANVGSDTQALFGKAARRKVKDTIDGRVVYEDTNNSAEDFEVNVERQPHSY